MVAGGAGTADDIPSALPPRHGGSTDAALQEALWLLPGSRLTDVPRVPPRPWPPVAGRTASRRPLPHRTP